MIPNQSNACFKMFTVLFITQDKFLKYVSYTEISFLLSLSHHKIFTNYKFRKKNYFSMELIIATTKLISALTTRNSSRDWLVWFLCRLLFFLCRLFDVASWEWIYYLTKASTFSPYRQNRNLITLRNHWLILLRDDTWSNWLPTTHIFSHLWRRCKSIC